MLKLSNLTRLFLIVLTLTGLLFAQKSFAVEIKEISSFRNVKAWLVESHEIPFVTMEVTFRAGSAFEGEKYGLANFTASLLDEGAGRLNSENFQKELERLGSSISASAGKLSLTVKARMLSENIDATFKLLEDVINNPKFDKEAIERIRQAIISSLKQGEESAAFKAGRAIKKAIYEDHVYSFPTSGYISSVSKITREDIVSYHKDNFNRLNMKISVVGDIKAQRLAKLLDKTFRKLPFGKIQNKVAEAPIETTASLQKIEMDIPQTHIKIAHEGISRHDEDYFASYVMNYILGGGGFNSRLMEEIREKRGLAYGVSSYFSPLPQQGAFIASVQTKSADAERSIHLILEEMQRMKDTKVSEKEYQGAINYLAGSFPLRIDSNQKILGYLSVMQSENLGKDYLNTWVDKIKIVTKMDIQRVAQRLLHPDRVAIVAVGKY